ncbi:MAG TPA: DUF3467 domain-containing protein [Candidatus Binatia bacterium]|nr:DUF3467 domain-containing protein [Candidatus Binatia bacterium]
MRHEGASAASAVPPEGRYANYFEVGHNAVEFLVDCGQFYPDEDAPRVHTRIVTSPVYAKALGEALRQAIERYEAMFGPIRGE